MAFIPEAKTQTLFSNLTTTCGEGPVWLEDLGELVFIDFLTSTIFRYNNSTDALASFSIPGRRGVSVAFPSCERDKFVVASWQDIIYFDWNTRGVQTLATFDLDSGARANDAKADRKGRFWFGSWADASLTGQIRPGLGSLYRLDLANNCSLTKADTLPVDLANGMEWSADDRLMFFTDSLKRVIYVFDFDITTGQVSNQRVAIDFNKLPSSLDEALVKKAVPDGCCVDTTGKLWTTCYYGSCVACFDVERGVLLNRVPVSSVCSTSCCFGGPHMNQMFVTSACEDGVTGNEAGGSLYRIDGLQAKGYHTTRAAVPCLKQL